MARRTARLDTLIAISLLHWVVVRQHGS
jgi:hypothetical protein